MEFVQPLPFQASTGPRPRGRGVIVVPYGVRDAYVASTGPRPRGRGVSLKRRAGVPGCKRFNGAAPARARSGWQYRKGTMTTQQLQRGRARAGAEWECRMRDAVAIGPGFNGAAPARA